MKENDFIISLLIFSIILAVTVTTTQYESCYTCSMYNENHNRSIGGMNGVAFGDKYYCVWTENRTNEDIANTEVHEKSHIMINKDKKHFCR